jgi:hypothetical protein
MSRTVPAFVAALCSDGPRPDRKDGLNLYAWLVGRWRLDVVMRRPDGSTEQKHGFVSAGWVLEGRAIQDVFAVPDLFYGSTLRVYDPEIDGWHCHWSDPLRNAYFQMIGRAHGSEIVNEGREPESLARVYGVRSASDRPATLRWIFSDITDAAFRWRSERSTDGTTWQLQREYFALRERG